MTDQSVNPYDDKILKTFEEFTDQRFEAALETAATCFATWTHTTFAERATAVAEMKRSFDLMHHRDHIKTIDEKMKAHMSDMMKQMEAQDLAIKEALAGLDERSSKQRARLQGHFTICRRHSEELRNAQDARRNDERPDGPHRPQNELTLTPLMDGRRFLPREGIELDVLYSLVSD